MKNLRTWFLVGVVFSGVSAWAQVSSQNGLNINDLKVGKVTHDSFTVTADFAGDANANASCELYYCNHSKNSTCLPKNSDHKAMVRGTENFSLTVTGLNRTRSLPAKQDAEGYDIPNTEAYWTDEPSDQFYIEMACQDADGLVTENTKKARTRGNLVLSPSPEFLNPVWESSVVANVQFDTGQKIWLQKDARSASDHKYYSINKEGKIFGDEILQSAGFFSFSDFRELSAQTANPLLNGMQLQSSGVSIRTPSHADVKLAYKKDLKSKMNFSLAALSLVRILDNEAMKRKISPTVSKARFDYVLSYIFNKNAAEHGKIPSDRATNTSFPKLFDWLKETVKTDGSYVLDLDWVTQPWMSSPDHDLLQVADVLPSGNTLKWPKVTLTLVAKGFPETEEEFEAFMLVKLNEMYRSVMRIVVWKEIQEEHRSAAGGILNSMVPVFKKEELRHYYDSLSSKIFKTRSSTVSTWELTVSGSQKDKFVERLYQLFSDYENSVLENINQMTQKSKINQAVEDARATAPYEVFSKAEAEFSNAIAIGALKVSMNPRYLSHDGIEPLDSTDSDLNEKLAFMFKNGDLDAVMNYQILPRYEAVLKDQSISIVFVASLKRGDTTVVPFENDVVQRIIKEMATDKQQGKVLRDLTYQMFLQNPVKVAQDTCDQNFYWPCLETDPVKMTEVLFPEVPFSDADMKGKTNTIQDEALFQSIMAIQSEPFSAAMQFPNFKESANKKFIFSENFRTRNGMGVRLKGFSLEY